MRTGREVLLVSSGAVASGRARLGWASSKKMEEKQACAAVGQVVLMDLYARAFRRKGLSVGQVLLVESDFDDRDHYVNARRTLDVLLKNRVVPVINENDTVSTSEIVFGDNDMLSALITNLSEADLLVILTSVDGLLDGQGRIVEEVGRVDDVVRGLVKKTVSTAGRGGMETKLKAMETVTVSGKSGVVASANEKDVLRRICSGEAVGTWFHSAGIAGASKKKWLAFGTAVKGRLVVDAGAEKALTQHGKSLLAGGVTAVEGLFAASSVVEIVSIAGGKLGRGICACSSADLNRIKGLKSSEYAKALGKSIAPEIVHRDNLVLY
jgi:glutamate 5-kinase